MSTPHNQAPEGAFAKTVLMPGDPLRAKFIAENFLTDVVQVNSVRNMLGYTGYYKGKKVSVMGSGMGMPSIGIYSHELYSFYGVEKIIRIGTCGAYAPECKVFDLILAEGACTNSNWAHQFALPGVLSAIADFDMLIVGSDQVWRPSPHVDIYHFYLDFAKDWNVKRIAYAASFGTEEWEYTLEETEKCKHLVQLFDKVTVLL